MEKFVKLYEDDEVGQVLVVKTQNYNGHPHLRIIINVDGMEVAGGPSINGDRDEDWDRLDAMFDEVTEESAIEFAKSMLAAMRL